MSRVLHQVVAAAVPGDAITSHALTLRGWLREWGHESELYAVHIHDELAQEVRPLSVYRPGRDERFVIYHHSIGSPAVDQLLQLRPRLLLIYHNITPAEFFLTADPVWTHLLTWGREQLNQLRDHTHLGMAVSRFNASELEAAGYEKTAVLPLILDEARYDQPVNEELAANLRGDTPLLLFVGRFAPNKRQEDLLQLLYHLQCVRPGTRLALVGDHWLPDYSAWLKDVIRRLGLVGQVLLPGRVSDQDLVTYYRCADLFVSMSEHEGFCMPLIESMYLCLPILAYAATAVPGTLNGTGVLFHQKHYPALAELVDLLLADTGLRQRLVARQQERVQAFLAPAVRQTFRRHLQSVGALTP